jgi:putative transposase
VNVYPFIEAERAKQRNVKRACALLEVSRAAFYDWVRHVPSPRLCRNENLLEKIKAVHEDSRGTYGSPRVHAQLRKDGEVCGRNRVARLMQANGIVGRARRRFKRTTIPDPDAAGAVDLVKRVLWPRHDRDRSPVVRRHQLRADLGGVDVPRNRDRRLQPPRRGLGDGRPLALRARLRCAENGDRPAPAGAGSDLSLRPRIAVHVVGVHRAARAKRHPPVAVSARSVLGQRGRRELFSTLKCELIHLHALPTRARVRSAIFEYIEGWFNRRRRHSSLGYISPAEFELRYHTTKKACWPRDRPVPGSSGFQRSALRRSQSLLFGPSPPIHRVPPLVGVKTVRPRCAAGAPS